MQQINKANINEFAIISLCLGILSFIQLGGIEKGLAAVVFGILGLKKIAAPGSSARGEGLAAAGIVLGVIFTFIAAIAFVALARDPQLLEKLLKAPLVR